MHFIWLLLRLAVAVALGIGTLLRPGIGLDMSKIQVNASDIETMESASLAQTILNIIPDNPFKALANGEMLQVIVFALVVGVILAKLGERAEVVANFISQFNDIMMEMTMMVSESGTHRCIQSYCKNFCQYWLQCVYSAGEIYDCGTDRAGNPVLWSVSDFAQGIYALNPVRLSRNFSRLWLLPFPRQHPMQQYLFPSIRCIRKWVFPKRFLPLRSAGSYH